MNEYMQVIFIDNLRVLHARTAFSVSISPISLIINDRPNAFIYFLKRVLTCVLLCVNVIIINQCLQGYRQMCGCYLSRDNLMAKARLHVGEETRLQV